MASFLVPLLHVDPVEGAEGTGAVGAVVAVDEDGGFGGVVDEF